jgi:hypothetical protein
MTPSENGLRDINEDGMRHAYKISVGKSGGISASKAEAYMGGYQNVSEK